jgi:hypothetical protein
LALALRSLRIWPRVLSRTLNSARNRNRQRESINFRAEDQSRLREHCKTNFREHERIDVGKRPKLVVGGRLTGDWKGRIHPVPEVVYREFPAIPTGLEIGYLDGYAVVYDPVSLEIVEVLDVYPQE